MELVELIFKVAVLKNNIILYLDKLFKLPEETLVYPAHDYNGKKFSTIGSEKKNNPRLQVSSSNQYEEIMNNLNLANPKMMDVAVPANKKGLTLEQLNVS